MMHELDRVDLLDNPVRVAHQIYHVLDETRVKVFRRLCLAVPQRDQPDLVYAARKRRIERPAIVAFMDVVAFLWKTDAIGLIELVHERVVAHPIKAFLPAVPTGADKLSHVGTFEEWEVRLDRHPARHAAFHKEDLT